MTRNIGFSTGAAYRFRDTLSVSTIRKLGELGQPACPVEICFNDARESPALMGLAVDFARNGLLPDALSASAGLSVHAPVKGIRYGRNDVSETVSDAIRTLMQTVRIDRVVVHPDVIDDEGWEMLRYGAIAGLALENSDSRKPFGRSVGDMADAIDRLGCGLVLDLAHCYMVDPTMRTAYDFIAHLGDRIVETHLSGVGEREGSHVPLFKTRQDIILEPLRFIAPDIPIIIESTCEDENDFVAEYRYVSGLLS